MQTEQSYLALLTPEQMQRIEQRYFDAGNASFALMMMAGESVAAFIRSAFPPCPILVLAGPGNNGGDGYVIAEALRCAGWEVTLASFTHTVPRTPDAIQAHHFYHGAVVEYSADLLANAPLVVDAVFGTGLTKPLDEKILDAVRDVRARKLPVVAVDIPSGVHGETGAVLGDAFDAVATMTFTRKKLGHTLLPGKTHCGEVFVADIEIPDALVDEERPLIFQNAPPLWKETLPKPTVTGHKYDRGHAVILGGNAQMTGASRLSAMAAARGGAGLVSVVCETTTLPVFAASLTSIMTKVCDQVESYVELLKDDRVTALLVGPGAGVNDRTRQYVLAALASGKALVLDADALSVFAGEAHSMKRAATQELVITPHEGEFERLFKNTSVMQASGKLARTQAAAALLGAVVVHKGSDTIIAHPDGRAYINVNAPPTLATAGSGDVLAGLCCGLMAQGMPAFAAASAAVWMHAEVASMFGAGLIAEDLNDGLPAVIQSLQE